MCFGHDYNPIWGVQLQEWNTIASKPDMEAEMIGKSCTNCGWDNFNVNTCRVKEKEEPTIATIEAITIN